MADTARPERSLHDLVRFVGVGQAFQPAFTLGVSIIVSRALGPEGRGAYGLVVTTVAVLPMVVGFGLSNSVRYWTARGEVDRRSLLMTTTLVALGLGILSAGIVLASWVTGEPRWLVPAGLSALGAGALALILVMSVLRAFWSNYLVGLERYGFGTWGMNAGCAVQLAFLAGIWWLSEVSLDAAVLALGIQIAFTLVVFVALAGRDLVGGIRTALLGSVELRAMLRYGAWLYLSSLMMQTNVRLNVFLLAGLSDMEQTGLYTAVLGPANFLGLVAIPVITVLSARTTRRTADPTFPRRVAGALRMIVVVSTPPALAAAAVAPWLLPWVFGEKFRASVVPFWLLLPGVIAFSLVHAISQYLAGAKHPEWNTRVTAVGAILTIAFNLLLIPPLGAAGAALAYTLAFVCAAAAGSFAFLRVSGLPLRALLAFQREDWVPLGRVIGFPRSS